ncbi:MAG: tetratricopeptide repeat protein, partial [Thermoplasmata archaeon]|nr:tetratricopeptide repeat protein [Thermoplasmata archaeon]
METRAFVRLVGEMLEAMDQRLAAARPVRDGFVVLSSDRFLFVFTPRADRVSPASVHQWLETNEAPAERLVLFSPDPVSDAVRGEVGAGGGTVVDGPAFVNLVQQLGIESPLLPSTAPGVAPPGHYLPTVERLEAILARARSWEESGVPALSLRFYRQAAALKPEYRPALVGVARSLSMLGQWKDADAAWKDVQALYPDDPDARLGRAVVLGALGRTDREIRSYRGLVRDFPDLTAAHAGLLGALIESEQWVEARAEVETMLRASPSDSHLRLLSALACEHTGDAEGARLELNTARALGLTPGAEATARQSVEASIRVARQRAATA